MIPIPRTRAGPRPSKYIPEALEDQLRANVFDAVQNCPPALAVSSIPQLIIGNIESGCHGTYLQRRVGVEFKFHHCKMKHSTQCKCIISSSSPAEEETFQIPKGLDDHRVQLILGTCEGVPWRLEPKLAAIVAMKIFLGMDVPEPLGMKTSVDTTESTVEENVEEGEQEKNADKVSTTN